MPSFYEYDSHDSELEDDDHDDDYAPDLEFDTTLHARS